MPVHPKLSTAKWVGLTQRKSGGQATSSAMGDGITVASLMKGNQYFVITSTVKKFHDG